MPRSDADPAEISEKLRALSDPTRLRILITLGRQEIYEGAIAELLDERPSKISYHINELWQAGLVTRRKSGRYMFYQINTPELSRVLNFLDLLY